MAFLSKVYYKIYSLTFNRCLLRIIVTAVVLVYFVHMKKILVVFGSVPRFFTVTHELTTQSLDGLLGIRRRQVSTAVRLAQTDKAAADYSQVVWASTSALHTNRRTT